jgi:hypothetical protein
MIFKYFSANRQVRFCRQLPVCAAGHFGTFDFQALELVAGGGIGHFSPLLRFEYA